MNWMVIGLLIAATGLSLGLTRLMIWLAPRMGLVDEPGERRVHVRPIPRAGGLAVWLSFAVVCGMMLWSGVETHTGKLSWSWYVAFMGGSSVLVAVGIVDDRKGVRAVIKLACHALAAVVFYRLYPLRTGLLPPGVDETWDLWIFTVWAVILINSFNLIDGLDGLCGGLSLVSVLALAGLAWSGERKDAAIILLVMAGSIIGFLRFNLHPARIFLGDTGSMLMGFFLATAATDAVGRKAVVGVILLPIAIGGVPLLDVLLAVWRRGIRKLSRGYSGEKPDGGLFTADREHLHHRMLDLSGSQRKVAFLMQGVAILLAVFAFLPMIFGDRMLALSLVGFFVIGLIGLKDLARIEIESTGNLVHFAIKARGHKRKVAALLYIYDFVVLGASSSAAVIMETNRFVRSEDITEQLRFILVFMIFSSIALLLAKVHRRIWARATIRDLLSLQFWLLAAAIATFAVFSLVYRELEWSAMRLTVMTYAFATAGVCIPRVVLELSRSFGMEARHGYRSARHVSEASVQGMGAVALVGAGDMGSLFLEYIKSSSPDTYRGMRIVGFLDDNPALHGRKVKSISVLGGLEDVSRLALSHQLDGLIITISNPSVSFMEQLISIAKSNDLSIYRWTVETRALEI